MSTIAGDSTIKRISDDCPLPRLKCIEFTNGVKGFLPEELFEDLKEMFPSIDEGEICKYRGYKAPMFVNQIETYLTLIVPIRYFTR